MAILVTGAAGFVGFHLARRLLQEGNEVVGLDNVNPYYDVQLKRDRLHILAEFPSFSFHELDIINPQELDRLFHENQIKTVYHLAAQAGVRYSLENPRTYIDSNIVGFTNVLEACRNNNIEHLLYASSSSVYGANRKIPFSTTDPVNHPVSLYAATKKANELLAHTYSHLYQLPTTGMRLFTVYGPWGRPDMAYYSFTKAILEGKPIQVFNRGEMRRDFTYVDDIVEAMVRLKNHIPEPDSFWDATNPTPDTSYAPYQLYNIGNQEPVKLLTFINLLEELIGKKAIITFLPMQNGDVVETFADVSKLKEKIDYQPSTSLERGLDEFVTWYKNYYH
ncbi:NAD-dependent epimerase [Bacillus sp. DJP31]|uniref:NAD-dependent epimerase n=1 Tax=Bacillus sp. DJP31 TaxID=3409789 RepID=UPI003BB70515